MGKIINGTTSVTAQQFLSNATAGISTMSLVDSNTIDCSNIKISGVKAVLGSSSTSISALCQSPNINKGANFRPLGTPPYNLGDFAGYNHNAYPTVFYYSEIHSPLAATYSGSGIPISLVLAKGERSPDKDNVNYSWDRIRLELNTTGGLTSSLTNTVAMQGTTMSGSLTPVPFTIATPSNDYYTASAEVRGYFVSPGGQKLDEIPNLYRSFAINVVPTFTTINVDTTVGATPASYMLYYRLTSGGSWTRAQNAFSLKFDPNVSTPDKGSWSPPFGTWSDFFIIYKLNSSYIYVNVASVTNGLELKINNQWYRYNVTGYGKAFDVTSTSTVSGYPTINYGNIDWGSLTY